MKIAFVLDDSLDKSDGVQQYVLTLSQYYKKIGHEVHYLVGQTERTDLSYVHSLSRNLQVHFNQNRMSTPLPANKRAIKNLLAREQFDVLHVQMPYSPFLAARVLRLAPKRTARVGTFHIVPFSRTERIATQILGWLLWRTKRSFDHIVSVSEPAAAFLHSSWRLPSKVIPNVIDLKLFHNVTKATNDKRLTIVFLGRLVERKGCLELLRALAQLQAAHELNNVRVLIGGKGPLLPQLETFVHQHHLGRVVHFKGFIAEHDKPSFLAQADIAVFPSTGGESFGIVLIEAMAAGAHVIIGGDNVGYKSVLGSRPDQLVDPSDTRNFAKTLKHFLRSHTARQRASSWQKQAVMQYDVSQVGQELLAIYKNAIAKRTVNSDN